MLSTSARTARVLAPFSLTVLVCAAGATFAACSDDPPPTTGDDTGAVDTGAKDTATDGAVDSAATDSATDSKSDTTDTALEAETPAVCTLSFSTKLSEMGLYDDIKAKKIAAANVEFKPAYELWTDGAAKRRWINVPAGKKIDNTDQDQWDFPVCTTMWKEFARDGKIIETRFIRRISKDEFTFGTYVWNEAQTEATWTLDGVNNALGTAHDVPNLAGCLRCHEGIKSRILGFGAVQLTKTTPLDLAAVAAKGWLTATPPKDYVVPGNATEQAALGWLNANCGHCHNPLSTTTWTQTDMVLRVYPSEAGGTVADTKLYKTTVGVPNMSFKPASGPTLRIDPGVTATSTIYVRDASRDGGSIQMPPLGTEIVHTEGLAAVKAWIDSLPKVTKPDAGTD